MRLKTALLALVAGCGGGYDTGWDEPEESAVDPLACPGIALGATALQWDGIVGGVPEVRTLEVTNDCVGVLFLKVEASIVGDPLFVLEAPELQIAPGATKTLEITFDARDVEEHRATLNLALNELEPVSVELLGYASSVLDADGDGYLSIEDGGEDCDDSRADVYPGAPDVCYDDVDSACDGGDEFDCDGDGEQSADYGGTDCDDTRTDVGETVNEIDDGVDNDCDELIDEDFIEIGELFISELMLKPSVGWQNGQWIEIHNASDRAIDMDGWTITATGGYELTIEDTLLVDGGGYAVFGPSNESTNGGVRVSFDYSTSDFALLHSGSTLTLAWEGKEFQRLTYTSGMVPPKGYTLQRDGSLEAWTSMQSSEWCAASTSWPDGDFGSPGADNDTCPD